MHVNPVFKPDTRDDFRSGFDNAPPEWVNYNKLAGDVKMEQTQKDNGNWETGTMRKQWHDPEFFLYSGRANPPYPPRDYHGRTTQGPPGDYPAELPTPHSRDHSADQWRSTKKDPPRDYNGQSTQYDPPVDYIGRATHGAPINGHLGRTGIHQNDHSRDYNSREKESHSRTHEKSRGKHKGRHDRSGDRKNHRERENHRDHKKHMSGFDREPDFDDPSSASKSMDELLKSRRDSMTGCHQFLRYATTLFTFIVFIAGAGLLGLGIYILGSDYGAKQMSEVLGNDLYQIAAYVLIATGSILVLISVCGCCGAMRESRIMLGVFIFAIATLVVALVAAAAMVFVFRQKMEGDIVHSMEDVLLNRYGVDLTKHSENRVVTDMWNWLQRELKCCGVTGDVNSTTSWAIYQRSDWYQGFITGMIYVPESCCDPNGDMNICTGITPIDGPPTKGPPLTASMLKNPHLYTIGCYDELVHYIQDHAVMIGVASIASVVIMLFGLFFAVYLCRRVNMLYY